MTAPTRLTIPAVARAFAVSPSTVRRVWLRRLGLPHHRTAGGRQVRFRPEDLADFARRHGLPPPDWLAAVADTGGFTDGAGI